MKPEKVYQELKNIAETNGLSIIEKSFRNIGVPVQSGLCKVKGKQVFLLDKNLPRKEKNALLKECLLQLQPESASNLKNMKDAE